MGKLVKIGLAAGQVRSIAAREAGKVWNRDTDLQLHLRLLTNNAARQGP